jgi:uracil-DNA glycosylase
MIKLPNIEKSWQTILHTELNSNYIHKLNSFLLFEEKQHNVYPPSREIFNAFNLTPFKDVKVVIIGQDPYHNIGQAHGLSFSVKKGTKTPPSLKNIFKELKTDLDIPTPAHGNLENWAAQGVLLLNATLTVRANEAGSHQKQGWETFTDATISAISNLKSDVVFILWGKFAQNKEILIDANKHHILKAAHPSPFSAYRGFLGCKHFSKTNELLKNNNQSIINWKIG